MREATGQYCGIRYWALLILAVLATACTEADQADIVTPPKCQAVTRWGNGATCSASDPSLSACGSGNTRTCASGWLCLDAPALLDCSCQTDTDCEGRSQYINEARTAKGIAPLAAKCVAGRCSGEP
jgi:hypothetical protein